MIRSSATLLAIACLGACGGAVPYEVTRRLGGERVVGRFVSPHSYEWFLRGELALARGDLDRAAAAYRHARAGPEDDPLVLARLATVLDRAGRTDAADRVIDEGLVLDASSEAIWLAKAHIEARHGRLTAATAAFERAEAAAPTSERAPLALSRLLREQDAGGRADAVLRRFIARNGRATPATLRARLQLAVARHDGARAERAAAALLEVAPTRGGDVARTARALLLRGRPVLAARLLDASQGEDVPLRLRALIAAGRQGRAEALLATATDAQVGGPLGRARLYLGVGRADRVVETLGALRADPDGRLLVGLAHLALGEYGAAAAALASVPRQARAHTEARQALSQALRGAGAFGLAAEVTSSSGRGEPGLQVSLARARSAAGDLDGALAALSGMTSPGARAFHAALLERAGRGSEAEAAWRAVATDAAGLAPGHRARARAEGLWHGGRHKRAIALLRRRTRNAPEDLWARLRLAEMLAQSEHVDEARAIASATVPLAVGEALRTRLTAVGL